jgi:CO/xanthine dehydrogenase Mo-binding subunit
MSNNNRKIAAGVKEIGCSAPRLDAIDKVTGSAVFAADLYPADLLWAGVKRPEHPHARILAIDTAAALAIPGVVAALTYKDIKGSNRLGIFEKDQPILADERVRHYGDAVALLVAESKEALAAAVAAVRVEYDSLPTLFDPAVAQAADSPILHPQRPAGNLLIGGEIRRGDAATALTQAVYQVTLAVSTTWQEHAFLETQAGVAQLESDGTLTMTVSTQTPFRDRLELAEAIGLSPAKIHVIAPCLGGGFGGKDGITVQGFLALAALHSGGRPVKLWYSREESILAGTKRHPLQAEYTLGCSRDGQLQALSACLLFDTGAYASLGSEVFALAMENAGGPYRIPHVAIDGAVVYTNNPISGAFRGFGVPQVAAAMEQALDALARIGGFDPLELRRQNAVVRGDTSPTGVVLTGTVGIGECLDTLERHPLWQQRQSWLKAAPRFKRRGIGIAAVAQSIGYGPAIADCGNAKLELLADGSLRVYVGVSDMGQGNASTYAQITGHILGQPQESMELVFPDTARTLPSGSASASRTTFTYGNAMIQAAELLGERIKARAALMISFQLLHSVKLEDMALLPGRLLHVPSGRSVPLALVATLMDATERMATASYTAPVNDQPLDSGANLRMHGFPHRLASYGVQLAALEVDTLTGETAVCQLLSCIDAGRVLNPQLYEQQVQGGAAQGLGYALFEEFTVNQGRIRTGDLSTYILPTALDVPDMLTVPISSHEPAGPFGMKGIGEIGIDGVLPAIANALAAATGCRIGGGTLNAEKVLAALRQTGQEAMP